MTDPDEGGRRVMTDRTGEVARALTLVLQGLDLPPILPGETVPDGVRTMLMEGDGISLRRGRALFYGENGEPINAESREAMKQIATIRKQPGGEIGAVMYNEEGVRVSVSTAYLGVDISACGPLPLVWETLVFIVGGPLKILEPLRYGTRAAAHAGHEKIYTAVRQALWGTA